MGSSLRKKRRAKPSGSTVKVGRVKKTKQHVKVVPVRLPGAAEDTAWKEDTTHVGNYSVVGIVSDPNAVGKTERNSKRRSVRPARRNPRTRPWRPPRSSAATRFAVCWVRCGPRVCRLKRLAAKQRRVVGALVAKHGHDLNAMARDRN